MPVSPRLAHKHKPMHKKAHQVLFFSYAGRKMLQDSFTTANQPHIVPPAATPNSGVDGPSHALLTTPSLPEDPTDTDSAGDPEDPAEGDVDVGVGVDGDVKATPDIPETPANPPRADIEEPSTPDGTDDGPSAGAAAKGEKHVQQVLQQMEGWMSTEAGEMVIQEVCSAKHAEQLAKKFRKLVVDVPFYTACSSNLWLDRFHGVCVLGGGLGVGGGGGSGVLCSHVKTTCWTFLLLWFSHVCLWIPGSFPCEPPVDTCASSVLAPVT